MEKKHSATDARIGDCYYLNGFKNMSNALTARRSDRYKGAMFGNTRSRDVLRILSLSAINTGRGGVF